VELGDNEDSTQPDASTESSKVDYLLQRLKELWKEEPAKKVIIFSQFPEMLALLDSSLKARGISFLRFDGSVNQEKRSLSLDQFKNDPNSKVFVMSTKLAACGLTLITATHAFMMDPTLSPGLEEQAINRIHRIGQKKGVTIEKLIIRNTIEERILELHKKFGKGNAGLRKEDKKKVKEAEVKELLNVFNDDISNLEFNPKPPVRQVISITRTHSLRRSLTMELREEQVENDLKKKSRD